MREPIIKALDYLETAAGYEGEELSALATIRQELEENTATMLRLERCIHKKVKATETDDFLTRGENV